MESRGRDLKQIFLTTLSGLSERVVNTIFTFQCYWTKICFKRLPLAVFGNFPEGLNNNNNNNEYLTDPLQMAFHC